MSDMEEFLNILESKSENEQDSKSQGNSINSPGIVNKDNSHDSVQWQILPDGMRTPGRNTSKTLEPGVYKPKYTDKWGWLLQKEFIATDEIVKFKDCVSENILESIQTFWNKEYEFKRRGQIFKRGILLCGPAGSGKSVTISLLAKDLIERGGIVLYNLDNPSVLSTLLKQVRIVEPNRKVICIFEDIDDIIRAWGEMHLLSILDGENQIGSVVNIATTNYPELLPSRLVNRPSRFDEVVKVGMPSKEARIMYLQSKIFKEEIKGNMIEQWANDTDNFSIAHLRELINAVFCLGRSYEETLKRLRTMTKKINEKEIKGFN